MTGFDDFDNGWFDQGDDPTHVARVAYGPDQAELVGGVDDSSTYAEETSRRPIRRVALASTLIFVIGASATALGLSFIDPQREEPQAERRLEERVKPAVQFTEVVRRPGKLVYKTQIPEGMTPEQVLAEFNLVYGGRCGPRRDLLDARGMGLYDTRSKTYSARPGDKVYFTYREGPCVEPVTTKPRTKRGRN